MNLYWIKNSNKGTRQESVGGVRLTRQGKPSIQRLGEVCSYQDASVLFGQHR